MPAKKTILSGYCASRFFYYLGLLTIGLTILRPAYGLTISDWFFLISLGFAIPKALLERKIKINFPEYMLLGLLLFTIGGVVSSSYSKMPLVSFWGLFKYLYLIVIWFWLGVFLLKEVDQIKTAIIFWTASAAISSFGAIISLFWDGFILGQASFSIRMTGLTEHVNELGGLTGIAMIPAIMMLKCFAKKKWHVGYFMTCLILIFGGLFLSVSMSGAVALLVSLLVWLKISRFKMKDIIFIMFFIILLTVSVFYQEIYQSASFKSRFNEFSNQGLSLETISTRFETYGEALKVINNNPIIGVGLGHDLGLTITGYAVHNIFLLNLFQSGLLGLLGIIIIIIAINLAAYQGINNSISQQEKNIGIALFSSFLSFLILGLVQPIYYNRYEWISAALLIALYSNRKRAHFKINRRQGSIHRVAID